MELTKIPSILHNLDISFDLGLSEKIVCQEGKVILAQVLDDKNANARIELSTGRIGVLVTGDIIPGVLGKRRATREFIIRYCSKSERSLLHGKNCSL